MAKNRYDNDYPSVTQILGVLRKPGLENWFKYNTAKFCNEESNKGKLIGTQIHQAIHDYITTNEVKVETTYTEEVTTALKSFIQFRRDKPEYKLINAEMPLLSEKFKFNGTLDCLAERDDLEKSYMLLADWKTGKCKKKDKPDIYDEYLYQVAAYVYLYNEVNKTNIEKAIILAIAKDKVAYNYREMGKEEITDCFNQVFLPALKIYNYQNKEEAFWKTN